MLARMEAQQSSNFMLYDSPLEGLQSLLDFDCSGCPETVVNFQFKCISLFTQKKKELRAVGVVEHHGGYN